ncbi:MAG: endonuclease domain-containing protein [Candidatus Peribacteraceae bacterium]|nr:endonuclease domain-containing protein [Candidatus Peribacteraceae bacterium]MDD5739690.1 endonuclease domain-containing protein [Candidatus Peribacteraceae bacterium]
MLQNFLHCTHKPKIHFARHLRRSQTTGEQILWKKLRAKRFHRLKFRRQVPIGPFIVDFLCLERRLIIEVDGDSHFQPGVQQKDRKREDFLREQGFTIFRFKNGFVVEDCDLVLTNIGEKLGLYQEQIPSP